MSGPPAQGYKLSGEGYAGGGPDGTQGANTSKGIPGGTGGTGQTRGPQQDIAGTLPTDFKLANTKAESKGEAMDRQPIYAHDEDIPARAPHGQVQRNDGYKPVHSQTSGPAK